MLDAAALPLAADRPYAVLADLHANLEATEAVAEWLDRNGSHPVLVLGDLIGYGAAPAETLALVRERRWVCIRGNHEDMLLDSTHVERTRALKKSAFRALRWTREQLDEDAMEWLRGWPLAGRFGQSALAVHGSLVDSRHCYAYIYEFSVDRNAERLRDVAPGADSLLWFGHTHQPIAYAVTDEACSQLELREGRTRLAAGSHHLLNPGSVGFPRDGDNRAAFAVYDPVSREVELVRLPYAVSSAAARIRRAGYDPSLADRLEAAR